MGRKGISGDQDGTLPHSSGKAAHGPWDEAHTSSEDCEDEPSLVPPVRSAVYLESILNSELNLIECPGFCTSSVSSQTAGVAREWVGVVLVLSIPAREWLC